MHCFIFYKYYSSLQKVFATTPGWLIANKNADFENCIKPSTDLFWVFVRFLELLLTDTSTATKWNSHQNVIFVLVTFYNFHLFQIHPVFTHLESVYVVIYGSYGMSHRWVKKSNIAKWCLQILHQGCKTFLVYLIFAIRGGLQLCFVEWRANWPAEEPQSKQQSMMSFGAIGIIIVIVRVVLFCNLQGVSFLLVLPVLTMAKVGSLFGGTSQKKPPCRLLKILF